MAETTRSLEIAATTKDVWAALADFESISAWASDVDHSSLLSDQTDGVGMVRRIQTGRTTIVERVVTWEEGITLGYRIEGLPAAIRLTNTWHLEPTSAGTLASLTTAVDAGPRPPQQLIARGIAKRFAGVAERLLHGLRDHIVAPQGRAS